MMDSPRPKGALALRAARAAAAVNPDYMHDDLYMYDERPSAHARSVHIAGMCAACCGMVVLVTVVAALLRNPDNVGIETIWLVPSLCALPGAGTGMRSRYVSFMDIDGKSEGNNELNGVGKSAAWGSGSTLGTACPAQVQPTAQDFLLPAELDWAPTGHNESLVVFRGEGDTITLSFTLRDARGVLLLSEEAVELGDPPFNASSAAAPRAQSLRRRLPSSSPMLGAERAGDSDTAGYSLDTATVAAAEGFATVAAEHVSRSSWAGQRDLSSSDGEIRRDPAARRLLKAGGNSGTSHAAKHGGARSGSSLAAPHVTHASIGRPWGGGRPRATAYGLTGRRAVLAGGARSLFTLCAPCLADPILILMAFDALPGCNRHVRCADASW